MKQCLLCDALYNGARHLCPECWTEERQKELARVRSNNSRAIAHGKPATLTLQEWLATLDYFEWKCAYCQQAPYQALDHFIPFNTKNTPLNTIHKGTSADNCVPACRSCNIYKNDGSPEYLLKFYRNRNDFFPTREMIFRVAGYLGITFELAESA